MKNIIRLLFLLTGFLLVLLLSAVSFIYVITEDQPLVIDITQPDPQSLIDSKNTVKQVLDDLNSGNRQKIIFTHPQIDNLLSYFSRSFPAVLARYNYSDIELILAISIKLPDSIWGNYLNISSNFTDRKNLFNGSTSIGGLSVSNQFLSKITFFTSSLIFDNELVNIVEKLISNTSFTAERVSVAIESDLNTTFLMSKIKTELRKVRDFTWDENQFSRVEYYHNHLAKFSRVTQGIENVSLLDYLKPLFNAVRSQPELSDASTENTDAILALALFVGDYQLRQFLAQIINFYPADIPDLPDVLLAGRKDLMLHFLYSATFQLLSGRDLSLAIGEFKEIIDMDQGGSGFSFTDLAADRAGVQFAIMATDKSGGDIHLSSFLAKTKSEKSFVPDIFALPDQLSYSKFKIDYQNPNSQEYKIIVNEIDRRIRLLSLYKSFR